MLMAPCFPVKRLCVGWGHAQEVVLF